MDNKTKKNYNYKTLKVLPETHERLKHFSYTSGKEMIDVVDKITLFIDNNKLSYPQLLRMDTLNPAIDKIGERLETFIAILRSIESSKIDPLTKGIIRIENDVFKLLSNIEINKNLEFREEQQPISKTEEPTVPSSFNTEAYISLKNEKEIVELRLKEAADFFKIILSKLAQTSSGYKRSFTDDEVEFMKKYIEKCIVQ